MSRQSRNLFAASQEALKSTQTFKHGAVITGKGGKIIVSGHNKGNRTKVLNHVFTCVHAEMDVINKFMNGFLIPKYGNNYKKHTKKYDVWVVRLDGTLNNGYASSKPCHYCSVLLKNYGFNKIYFTKDNNTIECTRVDHLVSDHKSACQKKSEQLNLDSKLRLF